jgi:hypothetical protein
MKYRYRYRYGDGGGIGRCQVGISTVSDTQSDTEGTGTGIETRRSVASAKRMAETTTGQKVGRVCQCITKRQRWMHCCDSCARPVEAGPSMGAGEGAGKRDIWVRMRSTGSRAIV